MKRHKKGKEKKNLDVERLHVFQVRNGKNTDAGAATTAAERFRLNHA